jgi:hypothetical protein
MQRACCAAYILLAISTMNRLIQQRTGSRVSLSVARLAIHCGPESGSAPCSMEVFHKFGLSQCSSHFTASALRRQGGPNSFSCLHFACAYMHARGTRAGTLGSMLGPQPPARARCSVAHRSLLAGSPPRAATARGLRWWADQCAPLHPAARRCHHHCHRHRHCRHHQHHCRRHRRRRRRRHRRRHHCQRRRCRYAARRRPHSPRGCA